MTELDDRLALLAGQAHEWAAELRPYVLEADRDPSTVERLTHLDTLRWASALQIPPEYNPHPLVIRGHRFHVMSALERVVFVEESAWGDAGMTLGAPGAPMAGVLVNSLGSPEQKEWFFGRVQERPTWTFFALTEPGHGSDPGQMETLLSPSPEDGPLTLTGAKRFVGNAARGEIGVVFARTGRGPLGLASVLVESSQSGFRAEPIDTLGLRGAQLGAIGLDAVEIPAERILGRHLPPVQRGMRGWLRTFNVVRPTVAAIGLGLSRAAVEYVRTHRRSLRAAERDRLDAMERRIRAVRALTHRAAAAVDHDPDDGHLASAAKVSSARMAEEVTLAAREFFPAGARLDHPYLDKLIRDARGLEFMEGTRDIQRLNLFNALSRGALAPAGAAASR
jgi:acyl-CoA dehydrogenase